MPPVSPGLILLVAIVLVSAAFALGIFGVGYDEGQLAVRLSRGGRLAVTFDLRDTWFLLLLVIILGWSVAAAVDHSAWVQGSEKVTPAIVISSLIAWALALTRVRRVIFLLLSIPGIVIPLVLILSDQLGGLGSLAAVGRWITALAGRQQLGMLAGLLFLMMVSGFWTSWWTFRRRNGLVALLPTGTILAVEIINDPNPGLYLFTVFWLVCAAGILLRLNFVALKRRWRSRRVPRAADTGWIFGEVGFEATALLLLVAFVLPPLSTVDISTSFLPGSISTDLFHPFGLGVGKPGNGASASVGYSETVRPGAQLKARSQEIMVVSGGSALYPYLRGIALGGWDGISWYQLPPTDASPVRQQPRLEPKADLPREDLPVGSSRVEVVQQSIRILVPPDQLDRTVFSAGELTRVDNHSTTVKGIMLGAATGPVGEGPDPVNIVAGPPVPFDTVDVVRILDTPRAPYDINLTTAVPTADVKSLRSAGTDYAAWVQPYQQLYFQGTVAAGYSAGRDQEIASLARTIVQDAHALTVYDQAKAIEAWFRDPNRFKYTISPKPARAGVRPLDFFLFDSHEGYCQDFSTAMAVMLRSLDIPVRQMSGFSQGFYDDKSHRYLVNALNAHSWVEVYFPRLGWIPFEPTPDGANLPVERPATPTVTVPLPVGSGTAATPRVPKNQDAGNQASGAAGSGGLSDLWSRAGWVAVGLLLLLLVAALLMFRWLMSARDPRRIWRRLQFLADRLRVPRRPGDTPKEFGARLADAVPSLDDELRGVAELFTRANFRRGGLTRAESGELQRSWHVVRRSYPGLVVRAFRERGGGRPVRREAAAGLKSREPAPRRRPPDPSRGA